MAGLSFKKQSFVKILVLCLVLLGLFAGVIIANQKKAVLENSKAGYCGTKGEDCLRQSCCSGLIPKYSNGKCTCQCDPKCKLGCEELKDGTSKCIKCISKSRECDSDSSVENNGCCEGTVCRRAYNGEMTGGPTWACRTSCLDIKSVCSKNSECCSGLCKDFGDNIKYCSALPTAKPTAKPTPKACSSDFDCSSSQNCVSGSCVACAGIGSGCISNSDCCNDSCKSVMGQRKCLP